MVNELFFVPEEIGIWKRLKALPWTRIAVDAVILLAMLAVSRQFLWH